MISTVPYWKFWFWPKKNTLHTNTSYILITLVILFYFIEGGDQIFYSSSNLIKRPVSGSSRTSIGVGSITSMSGSKIERGSSLISSIIYPKIFDSKGFQRIPKDSIAIIQKVKGSETGWHRGNPNILGFFANFETNFSLCFFSENQVIKTNQKSTESIENRIKAIFKKQSKVLIILSFNLGI